MKLTLEYTHYSATAARYVQQTGDVKRKILTSNTLAHIINVQVIFKGENQLFDVLIYIYQYSSGEQKNLRILTKDLILLKSLLKKNTFLRSMFLHFFF